MYVHEQLGTADFKFGLHAHIILRQEGKWLSVFLLKFQLRKTLQIKKVMHKHKHNNYVDSPAAVRHNLALVSFFGGLCLLRSPISRINLLDICQHWAS